MCQFHLSFLQSIHHDLHKNTQDGNPARGMMNENTLVSFLLCLYALAFCSNYQSSIRQI